MEPAAAAGESRDPPPSPHPEDLSTVEPSPSSSSSSATAVSPGTQAPAPAPPGAREVAAAMEAVERDAAAIAESYASLFASLRIALSNVTSTSAENMECLGDVVGRLQESALEASSKGNKYINSCLRLNEEMRGLESLAMQLFLRNSYAKYMSRSLVPRQPTAGNMKWLIATKEEDRRTSPFHGMRKHY